MDTHDLLTVHARMICIYVVYTQKKIVIVIDCTTKEYMSRVASIAIDHNIIGVRKCLSGNVT